MKRFAYTALLLMTPLFFAACDFSGIENIGDDFDIIIELQPINTLVTGQIVDAATGAPIEGAVTLTFDGPAAPQLIDVYSDPISELTVKHGLVSFGIDNALQPSEGNPVEFTVVATAPGYRESDRSVILTEEGSGEFIVRLSSSDARVQAAGTSATEDRTATSSAASGVAQSVVVVTPAVGGTSATATATIGQGTIPRTADGTALEGALTTTLRVFDSKSGLRSLPSSVRRGQPIAGAVEFKVSDGAGRVAATFSPSAESTGAGKSSAVCTGGVEINVTLTDSGIVNAYEVLKASDPDAQVSADIFAYSASDGQNVKVGSVVLEDGASSGEVTATLCLGGSSSSVDESLLGNVADGIIYSIAVATGQTTTCAVGATLNVTNPNGFDVTLTNLSLIGPGLNIGGGSATLPPGTSTLNLRTALSQSDPVTVVNGVPYSVSGFAAGDLVAVQIDNVCSGSYGVTVPSVTVPVHYDVTATMACPAGQKFDVQLTEQSLNTLSVSYRPQGASSEPFTFVGRDQFTRSITNSSITAEGDLSLLPSETYRFRVVYGTDVSTFDIDTPASAGPLELTFDPDDAGIGCRAI